MANALAVVAGRNYLAYAVAATALSTIPADTVAYGATWGTPSPQTLPWVDLGYTDGGLHVTIGQTFNPINVDQEVDPVLYVPAGRDLRMSTTLAEMTPANIQKSTGSGAITTLAAISGTRGHTDLDVNGTIVLTFLSVGFDIQAPGDNEAFRFVGWRTIPAGAPALNFVVNSPASIAFEARCLPDTSTSPARVMKVRDVLAALP